MSQAQPWLEDKAFREYLKALVSEMVAEFVRENELRARELSLLERVVRVEEELKALREIETARFEAMEKRFESLQREMNARFESLQREMNARFEVMEKRFEALQREMNARFETVERRLTFTQWMMGIGFTFLALLITLGNFLLR